MVQNKFNIKFNFQVGESGTGKTNSVKTLATLTGQNLRIMSCNSAMDTMEVLGGFEQVKFFLII